MKQPHSSKDFDKLRRVALRFQNRAAKYHSQGDAVRPEGLYLRALDMQQTVWGSDHPEVAHTLNNLALYYKQLGRLAEARSLYERALVIFRNTQGASHQNTATTMYNLAQLFKAQGKEMDEPIGQFLAFSEPGDFPIDFALLHSRNRRQQRSGGTSLKFGTSRM